MTESQVTYEANNVVPPLKNSAAMKCIAVLIYGPATQTQDLNLLFAKLDQGHYLTLKADGGKCYVAFGSSAGTIDETATGNANTTCWPLADGERLDVRPTFGEELSTGTPMYKTQATYNILHFKGATGAATGYLRIFRSSLSPNQEAGFFRAP